jgi:hypothetical protein
MAARRHPVQLARPSLNLIRNWANRAAAEERSGYRGVYRLGLALPQRFQATPRRWEVGSAARYFALPGCYRDRAGWALSR